MGLLDPEPVPCRVPRTAISQVLAAAEQGLSRLLGRTRAGPRRRARLKTWFYQDAAAIELIVGLVMCVGLFLAAIFFAGPNL